MRIPPLLPFAIFLWCSVSCAPATGQVSALQPSPVRQCINLGNALEAPADRSWGLELTERDIERVAETGFETIRLPVAWTQHLLAGNRIDPAFQSRVDRVVRWALERDLQVIVNVHHDEALMEDFPRYYPRLVSIWDQLSAHYADWPPELIFEIVNETHSDATVPRTNRLNREILARIRQRHATRWVVVGGGGWGALGPLTARGAQRFDPPRDPFVLPTFHYYDPFDFTHQGASFTHEPIPMGRRITAGDVDRITRDMDDAARFALATGQPLLLGEFGVFDSVPVAERAAWTRLVRQLAERRGMGWCAFSWSGSFAIYDPDTDTVDPQIRAALLD